jgi:hypothetical protein
MKVVVATPACRGANSRRHQQREAHQQHEVHQQPLAFTARSAYLQSCVLCNKSKVNRTPCVLGIATTCNG